LGYPPNDFEIITAAEGAIQIDDVDPARTVGGESLRDG
jgi:hypothetical protein